MCALKDGRLFLRAAERVHALMSASLKFYHEAVERVHALRPACPVAKDKLYLEVEWHEFSGDGLKDTLAVRVPGR